MGYWQKQEPESILAQLKLYEMYALLLACKAGLYHTAMETGLLYQFSIVY